MPSFLKPTGQNSFQSKLQNLITCREFVDKNWCFCLTLWTSSFTTTSGFPCISGSMSTGPTLTHSPSLSIQHTLRSLPLPACPIFSYDSKPLTLLLWLPGPGRGKKVKRGNLVSREPQPAKRIWQSQQWHTYSMATHCLCSSEWKPEPLIWLFLKCTFFFLSGLRVIPKALHILSKLSTTKHEPLGIFFFLRQSLII